MAVSAQYFDGEIAKARTVEVNDDGANLTFSGTDTPYTSWNIKGLHSIDPPAPGQPFRMTHEDKPGARLIIRDEAFIKTLISRSPHLKGGYSGRDIAHIFGWTVGGLAAVAGIGYLALTFLPDRVAHILPNTWRDRVGKQIEDSMVSNSRICHSTLGDEALATMVGNLAEGSPDMPAIAVRIYDMPILNAFTVPGGHIILTRELIEKADSPEELAGVLAHEIGHVAFFHPEAQLVRLSGMQVLVSIFTGSNGGDLTADVAFMAAILRYSREAEWQADGYARQTLVNASIDPEGLKRFFLKIIQLENGGHSASGPLAKLGGLFNTHPGTEDRIKAIEPLPAGKIAKPALTADQWKALKDICKG
jgi:Zn-dependent protease with chaperone function